MSELAVRPTVYLSTVKERLHEQMHTVRSVIKANMGKHSAYVVVRKAVLFPTLDLMEATINSMSGNEASYTSAVDVGTAWNTINRLLDVTSHGDYPITHEEAENLATMFQENYTRNVRSST